MTVRIGGYFWVCVDCMLTHANGECGDIPEGQPQPWALWTNEDIAMGGEHADDCLTLTVDGEECDCETIEFTWSQCEGCGSYLGGSRYAFCWFVPSEALTVLFTVEWQSGAITRDIVPAADIPAHIAPYVAPDTLPTIATITITENEV